MEIPVHIEFQGMEPQEGLRVAIARHVAALEKRYGRITSCRVVLKSPGQHHRTGGFFEVRICIALPDEKEVNVGHKPDADERHADVNFAINDAFKHAQRRLQNQVRRMQGHVKTHVRCSINRPCCTADLTCTNRMVGRRTASQIASASAASFLLRLTYAFTSFAGIRRTWWPSFASSRAQ